MHRYELSGVGLALAFVVDVSFLIAAACLENFAAVFMATCTVVISGLICRDLKRSWDAAGEHPAVECDDTNADSAA